MTKKLNLKNATVLTKAELKSCEIKSSTVTAAVDCMICDRPIPIYDYYVAPPVAVCDECRKRLKDLLYKESEEEHE